MVFTRLRLCLKQIITRRYNSEFYAWYGYTPQPVVIRRTEEKLMTRTK